VVLGMVPLALLVLNRYLTADGAGMRSATGPALMVAAVLAASWVGVNASPVRSAARFADILTYDSSRPGYSWETLGRHYQEQGLMPEAIAAQRKAVTISGNPRLVVNLCVMYRDAGMVDESKQLLRDLLKVNPAYWVARSILIQQLIADQEFEEGVAEARAGMKAEPTLGGYHFYYGKIMLIVGRPDDAEPALREARRLGVPVAMGEEIERMLAALPGMRN
jgi:predicted Zn-dependent protease